MTDEHFSMVQSRVRQTLRESDFYGQVMDQFESFVSTLTPTETRLIQKGRSSHLFKNLQRCEGTPSKKCIQNIVESSCENKMKRISECMMEGQRGCKEEITTYIDCLKNTTRRFYLSTVLPF